jgi:hypothetical protein
MTKTLAIAFAALALVACKRKPPAEAPDASQSEQSSETPDAEPPKLAPARCKADESGTTLAEASAEIEIGEAVATTQGFAIGALRKVNGESVASLAMVPSQAGAPLFVDLGAPLGDASPPKAFVRGADTFAAYFPRPATPPKPPTPKQQAFRDLAIVRIADGKAQPPLTIAQQRDESLAFDVASSEKGALVAWDEDAIGNERGAIKIALFASDMKSVASSRIASPDSSDAEMPRVLARRGGYWLVWIASRSEVARDAAPDPSYALERPGRDRAFRWLEMLPLDERGEATGPTRKLTSERGHVSLFDMAARDGGAIVDIVVRDDGQESEGTGGRILRVTIKGDAPEAAIAIVSEAVGRGAPDLLSNADAAWLAYDDTTDKLRLLPLDAARIPSALPSLEDALDRARPLVATKATADAIEMLAVFPQEASSQLRRVRCAK